MSKQNKKRPNRPKGPETAPRRPIQKSAKGSQANSRPEKPKGPPWLFGRHAVIAALQNPERHIHQIWTTREFTKNHGAELDKALHSTERKRPDPLYKERTDFDHLFGDSVHQGIAIQVDPLPSTNLSNLLQENADRPDGLFVALDQATDPQNIGAVLRSAAAFGALGVIIPDKHAPDATAIVAKAACGAMERIALIRVTNLARTMEDLQEDGYWSVGMDGYADQHLYDVDLKGKILLVMGSEGSGLRRLTREKCDFLAKIPISHTVESLNLSNATAVSLYEIARQRSPK